MPVPVLRKTGKTVIGWVLTLVGVAALVLPGPGLLLVLAGLAVLSQEYQWAERRVEPVKRRAFEAAAAGVKSWPRVLGSALGGLGLTALGVAWGLQPTIPTVWVLGPQLPLAGWATGSSLILSGLAALGLLAYSVRRFRRNMASTSTTERRRSGPRCALPPRVGE